MFNEIDLDFVELDDEEQVIPERSMLEEHQDEKARHLIRRKTKRAKTRKRIRTVVLSNTEKIQYDGKRLKFPKNSNSQRLVKKATNRKARNYEEFPEKGNTHRRLVGSVETKEE